MHKLKARLHPTFALVFALLSTTACVEQFEGSNLQIDFGPFVPAQALPGTAGLPGGLELPSITHYRLWGIVQTRDTTGAVIASDYTELQRFEIRRIVELRSPCFIDPEGARFPGLHVTGFVNRMKSETGIQDIAAPPAGATEEDKIDMATALQREININAFGSNPNPTTMPPTFGGLKAVTSVSTARYPALAPACIEDNPSVDQSLIPPLTCIGDESNKLRLQACQKFWNANPGFYEGSDRILTEPLAGEYFGVVTGVNPLNGAFLGGTQFFIDRIGTDYNAFSLTYQFDDQNGDGTPDLPQGFPAPPIPPGAPTDYGSQLLSGVASQPTRGVIRSRMEINGGTSPAVYGQLAIFSDIGDDNVHF